MCIPNRIHSTVMEVFLEYDDSIVGILEDSTFYKYEILMQDLEMDIPFGSDIFGFFKKHERTFKIFTLRYLEVQELGGDVEKVILKNNQYIKYINGLRKKKIGMVSDAGFLDSFDKAYWDRQNLFKDIVEDNILKHYQTTKGNYRYFTIDDALNFFSFSGEKESNSNSGEDLYNKFLNQNGDYDFTISKDCIAKYINSIPRFFCKKRIHFKGHRLNIYSLVDN